MYITLITAYIFLLVAWIRIDFSMAAIVAGVRETEAASPAARKSREKSLDDWLVCRIVFGAMILIVILSLPYIVKGF